MNNLDTLCYIQEQTSFVEDYNDFGYVPHKGDNGATYVTFEAVLQSFGVKNRNQREYDAQNVWDRIQNDEQIQDYLRRNSWIGEIDHPAPEFEDKKLTIQRISNPHMGNDSHYIRRPRLNGNLLEASIQTDNGTDAGRNMATKIIDGKIVPCFSARVLGSLQNQNGKPVVFVKKLVTYDWVLYPSHREAEAKMHQPIVESVDEFNLLNEIKIIHLPELAKMASSTREIEWLCESFGLSEDNLIGVTESGNSVGICEGKNVYVQTISDNKLRSKTKGMLLDWLKS